MRAEPDIKIFTPRIARAADAAERILPDTDDGLPIWQPAIAARTAEYPQLPERQIRTGI